MNFKITRTDLLVVVIASISLLAIGIIGYLFLGEVSLIIMHSLSVAIMLLVIFELYRRWSKAYQTQEGRRKEDYYQIESLFSLFFTLQPTLPFPRTRGAVASPDLLKKITELILLEQPSYVVEASSGVSTLVIAYCLKRLGKGKVIALENEAKYASISQSMIKSHHLENIATVIHAPLREFLINDEQWLWYNLDNLPIDQPIDFLVIDGPSSKVQKLSRYPALPLLYQYLNTKSTVILDDGYRKDEEKIVTLWEQEFKEISSQLLKVEKGAYLISKNY